MLILTHSKKNENSFLLSFLLSCLPLLLSSLIQSQSYKDLSKIGAHPGVWVRGRWGGRLVWMLEPKKDGLVQGVRARVGRKGPPEWHWPGDRY